MDHLVLWSTDIRLKHLMCVFLTAFLITSKCPFVPSSRLDYLSHNTCNSSVLFLVFPKFYLQRGALRGAHLQYL